MHFKNLEKALDTLKLYLVLDHKTPLTFSQLKKKFSEPKISTLYNKLDILASQGHLEKINRKIRGIKISPGGEQIEYKLTEMGIQKRKVLIKKVAQMIQPHLAQALPQKSITKENIPSSSIQDKTQLITGISTNLSLEIIEVLQEFYETIIEHKDNITDETLHQMMDTTLQKIQRLYHKEIQDTF